VTPKASESDGAIEALPHEGYSAIKGIHIIAKRQLMSSRIGHFIAMLPLLFVTRD
jgi:hypothetical protein